jgi:amidophosphoribosyltransferase
MCGIIALFNKNKTEDLYPLLFEGLTNLQHRGQDSYGFIFANSYSNNYNNINNKGQLASYSINNILKNEEWNIGLGHIRYSTTKKKNYKSQPFTKTLSFNNSNLNEISFSLIHNGNISEEGCIDIMRKMEYLNYKNESVLENINDSELILEYITFKFQQNILSFDGIIDKRYINNILIKILNDFSILIKDKGSYSCVLLLNSLYYSGIICFKDINNIRPLIYGCNKDKDSYLIASESIVLDVLGYEKINDIREKEIIIFGFDDNNKIEINIINRENRDKIYKGCIFEYVYFARPESIINEISVYKSRINMGYNLAQQIIKYYPFIIDKIDSIIPVPDTSVISATEIANILQKPLKMGIIKNRNIARTFIMKDLNIRKNSIKKKLYIINDEVKDKNILIVDDSIVRGNTSRLLVKGLRKNGANNIYFVSCAPPIINTNIYGIDISNKNNLIAYKHNSNYEEIAKDIGVDLLIYQQIDDLVKSVNDANLYKNDNLKNKYEMSIFLSNK